MPQLTAKPPASESPTGPAPETPPRRAQIVTAALLVVWLAVTGSAGFLSPFLADVVTDLELKYGWDEVLVDDGKAEEDKG